MKYTRFFIFSMILGFSLMASCSSLGPSEGIGVKASIKSKYVFTDKNIEIIPHSDTCFKDYIYTIYDNFDIAKYKFIGEINRNGDTIQLVMQSFYFNIAESQRCSSKMLIYQNKVLLGYYLFPCEEFDFCVIDNNIKCSLTSNPKCITFLDFDPSNPHDWYIRYTEENGDLVSFEKYDFGSSCFLPYNLIFAH